MARRKYCSLECRQRLRYHLNLRTGLLKALQTRYATFYFTDYKIIMDVLPHGSQDLYSFIYPRTRGKKPVDDYTTMVNILGNAWWAEKRRTNKRYLATQHILQIAQNRQPHSGTVRPLVAREPTRVAGSLAFLRLTRSDLESSQLHRKIKSAFRRQAMRYHPDQGGDAVLFRKLQEAYEQLVSWADNPTFTSRRGFPDKWFYDGSTNRWIQPTPIRIQIY
jgi:hypothetical protein